MSLSVSRTSLGLSLIAVYLHAICRTGDAFQGEYAPGPGVRSRSAFDSSSDIYRVEDRKRDENVKPMNPVAIWPSQRTRSRRRIPTCQVLFHMVSPV